MNTTLPTTHPTHRSARVVLACLLALAALPGAQAQQLPGQGSWASTLQPRDVDNNGSVDAYYDSQLNITWLKNANVNGPMTWGDALNWASTLNVAGITGWRLPKQTDAFNGCNDSFSGTNCGFNVNTASSELANLYYVKLGNAGLVNSSGTTLTTGFGITNAGPFVNLQPAPYWTAQADPVGDPLGTGQLVPACAAAGSCAYYFDFGFGAQQVEDVSNLFNAIAVHDGDVGVAPIPEPGSWALMLAGLALTVQVARRRAAKAGPGVGDRG